MEMPLRDIEKIVCIDHRITYFLGYYINMYSIFWERVYLICSRVVWVFFGSSDFLNSNIIAITGCNSSDKYAHYALLCLQAATAFPLLNLTHKTATN